jgi:hypothetical protein
MMSVLVEALQSVVPSAVECSTMTGTGIGERATAEMADPSAPEHQCQMPALPGSQLPHHGAQAGPSAAASALACL